MCTIKIEISAYFETILLISLELYGKLDNQRKILKTEKEEGINLYYICDFLSDSSVLISEYVVDSRE